MKLRSYILIQTYKNTYLQISNINDEINTNIAHK